MFIFLEFTGPVTTWRNNTSSYDSVSMKESNCFSVIVIKFYDGFKIIWNTPIKGRNDLKSTRGA